MKGSKMDPGNYKGIFLLDIAGKVLATVIDLQLKKLIDTCVSDTQCSFRTKCSTTHLIHAVRRAQEACRLANLKAYAVFIDFKKAFDSPPLPERHNGNVWSGLVVCKIFC
jgi:hypothetical protein